MSIVTLGLSSLVGMLVTWYVGIVFCILSWGVLFLVVGHWLARCPRCGKAWWSGMGSIGLDGWPDTIEMSGVKSEIETLVCRGCGLDIRLGLTGDMQTVLFSFTIVVRQNG